MTARIPMRRKMKAKDAAELLGVSMSTIQKNQAEPRAVYLLRARLQQDEVLAYFEQGIKMKDIAKHLNISYAAAHARLSRALIRRGEQPTTKTKKPQTGAQSLPEAPTFFEQKAIVDSIVAEANRLYDE